jgi:hypothetical protein
LFGEWERGRRPGTSSSNPSTGDRCKNRPAERAVRHKDFSTAVMGVFHCARLLLQRYIAQSINHRSLYAFLFFVWRTLICAKYFRILRNFLKFISSGWVCQGIEWYKLRIYGDLWEDTGTVGLSLKINQAIDSCFRSPWVQFTDIGGVCMPFLNPNFTLVPSDHLLLDCAPNLGPLISCWRINYFENCWYESVRILEVLKLLFQQFLNLSSSQRDMSGPILETLSNNR